MTKVGGLRWFMIGLIMLGSVMNYLTRSTLAVAAPTIFQDLHITEKQYSWIVGVFQGTIMAQPISGYVLDVLGLKIGLALFALAWSLTNMAHGLAHTWQALAGLRGMLGFSEDSANPAGMKATAEWFPARERGLAGGIYNVGASVGSMLAPPLGGVGDSGIQLALCLRDHGCARSGLGGAVVAVLSVARQASWTF